MKRNRSFGLSAVIIIAAAEQSFGASQNGSVMPMLASTTSLIVLAVLSAAVLIFLSFKRSGPKRKGPAKTTGVREFLEQVRVNRPQKIAPSFSKAAAAVPEPADILSLADPNAALNAVKALALKLSPEAVEALISALGYCQLCQLGAGPAQSIPNEFVRLAAAQVLAGFSAANFRDLAQIMSAMEAVAQEVGRKEEEAAADKGKSKNPQPYLAGLREVLTLLFGLLQAYLAQLPLGSESGKAGTKVELLRLEINVELRRFETGNGQLINPQFADDPVYGLLKAKSQALSLAVATP